MARLEFSAGVTVKTTPELAFDYFADYRHVAQVLEGVSRWEPVGGQTRGTGARYGVEMTAFGIPLRNVLRLSRWSRPKEIAWVSESGLIKQDGGFTLGTGTANGAVAGWHRVTVAAGPPTTLPTKYRDPERSGLRQEVKAGLTNTCDLRLD